MTDADRTKALELRLAGVSYAKIATTLNLADAVEARAAVLTALDDDKLDAADDAVLLEVQRVDRLHTALWPRAVKGDLGALDRLMRLSERRLALLDKARLNDTPPHAGTVSIGRASTGAAATR